MNLNHKIAVVIPCYKVENHILSVIQAIGPEVCRIYVVDDFCPQRSGDLVESSCRDERVRVIRHEKNQGVGGAVLTGFQAAIKEDMQIFVKIDGDGQMDPALIPEFILPIIEGEADYTKGNRFFDLEDIKCMPRVRLFGNFALSFMTKMSSGYWNLFDPTNGYIAIHADVAKRIPLSKISRRYFFETDMLFRLNILRAVVLDIPMEAKYANEVSGLKISRIIWEFLIKHTRNLFKRLFYNYYLRDMCLASIELPLGVILLLFGASYGAYHWIHSLQTGLSTPAGTIMLAALPILMGFQLILTFLSYDIANIPRVPFHKIPRNIKRRSKYNEAIDGK